MTEEGRVASARTSAAGHDVVFSGIPPCAVLTRGTISSGHGEVLDLGDNSGCCSQLKTTTEAQSWQSNEISQIILKTENSQAAWLTEIINTTQTSSKKMLSLRKRWSYVYDCFCLHVWMWTMLEVAKAGRGHQISWSWNYKQSMWVLGAETGSSTGAASVLNP